MGEVTDLAICFSVATYKCLFASTLSSAITRQLLRIIVCAAVICCMLPCRSINHNTGIWAENKRKTSTCSALHAYPPFLHMITKRPIMKSKALAKYKMDTLSQKYVPVFCFLRNTFDVHPASPVHVTVQSVLVVADRHLGGFSTSPATTCTRTRELLNFQLFRYFL